MNRKTLGVTVLLCLIMTTAYMYVVGRPLELAKDTSLSFDMPEDFKSILLHAALAPSGHNAQPWKVRYSGYAGSFTLFLTAAGACPR